MNEQQKMQMEIYKTTMLACGSMLFAYIVGVGLGYMAGRESMKVKQ